MAADKKFDVFGVGNAIVDTLAQVDDAFINDLNLGKGGMALMDSDAQAAVLEKLEGMPLRLASGGSAANTMVAVAQSGARACTAEKSLPTPTVIFTSETWKRPASGSTSRQLLKPACQRAPVSC